MVAAGTELTELERWFQVQCDGDWEHGHRIVIENLDNPGCHVRWAAQGRWG